MRFRNMVCLGAALVAFALIAPAADLAGKWTADVTGRNGETRKVTFTFETSGDTLTGTVTGAQGRENKISEGKIAGDDISFVVVQEFQGNSMKMSYTGKVSGAEIKFKSQREGGQRTQEFTAKRPAS